LTSYYFEFHSASFKTTFGSDRSFNFLCVCNLFSVYLTTEQPRTELLHRKITKLRHYRIKDTAD
jgi:hypothetical protein